MLGFSIAMPKKYQRVDGSLRNGSHSADKFLRSLKRLNGIRKFQSPFFNLEILKIENGHRNSGFTH